MAISNKVCRLCLQESDFNVSLFGNYCKKTNMLDKILVCVRIVVEESDALNTICYKCANNIEKYYEFIKFVKKCQTKLGNGDNLSRHKSLDMQDSTMNVKRHVTSYVREQVFDADYTFSFLETPEEKKECKSSTPFFSYFSPPEVRKKYDNVSWKTPKCIKDDRKKERRDGKKSRHASPQRGLSRYASPQRGCSRDIFESQSQEALFDDVDAKSSDWRLTPDDNIIKRVREKCFGLSDF